MSAAPKPLLTPEAYLEIEEHAEERSEYHDGEVFAMAGESPTHSLLSLAVGAEFRERLKGRACRAFSPNMKVWIASRRRFLYPDLAALCGQPQFFNVRGNALTNPTVIVEVLSKSTAAYDRGDKFGLYMTLPSLREYVLVSQWAVEVEKFTRESDTTWRYERLSGPDAVLRSEALGCEISLREIYADIELSPPLPEPIERDEAR